MLIADVPVNTGENLGILDSTREVGPGACVVAVVLLHILGHLLHVGSGSLGDIAFAGLSGCDVLICGCTERDCLLRLLG